MSLSESPDLQAQRELRETVCAVCGRTKRAGNSFCTSCYMTLSDEMKDGLKRRFRAGYESAYWAAKDWLIEERKARR
jgi:hypothetical protein